MGVLTKSEGINQINHNNSSSYNISNENINTMRSQAAEANDSARKIADRIFSQDIPSDVSVILHGVSYALHKFPLVARSSWMRRRIAEAEETMSEIRIPDSEFPGTPETFELVARFCYGVLDPASEIGPGNVAPLRCAAEYLEMSDACCAHNLISLTQSYLDGHIFGSPHYNLRNVVVALRSCEALLPLAEDLGIVPHCVTSAAGKAAHDHLLTYPNLMPNPSSGPIDQTFAYNVAHSVKSSPVAHHFGSSSPVNSRTPRGLQSLAANSPAESWIEDLSLLRIDFFHRVISAIKSHGTIRAGSIASAIVHYANQSQLRGLLKKQSSLAKLKRNRANPAKQSIEHELVEKLVAMLPNQPNVCSIGFLLAMLRAAIFLEASIVCRLDLEKRIGWQLEQAVVDDLLIPSYNSCAATDDMTLFDLDTVARIVISFLEQDRSKSEGELLDGPDEIPNSYDYDQSSDRYSSSSPPQSKVMKVARLLDCFLAEVAPDPNLTASKFAAFAELMPEYARVVDDGLYRAIDVYLKAHPGLEELDRKKICSLMECQKLSQEACRHASQNERLPVQVTVQVLYFEQMRLRKSYTNLSSNDQTPRSNKNSAAINDDKNNVASDISQKDHEMVAVQRENMELKMEVNRMKARLQNSSNNNNGRLREVGLVERRRENSTDDEEDDFGDEGKMDGRAIVGYSSTQDNSSNGGTRGKSRFFQSMSRKLGKLNPFNRNTSNVESGLKTSANIDVRTSRRPRRHSMS